MLFIWQMHSKLLQNALGNVFHHKLLEGRNHFLFIFVSELIFLISVWKSFYSKHDQVNWCKSKARTSQQEVSKNVITWQCINPSKLLRMGLFKSDSLQIRNRKPTDKKTIVYIYIFIRLYFLSCKSAESTCTEFDNKSLGKDEGILCHLLGSTKNLSWS